MLLGFSLSCLISTSKAAYILSYTVFLAGLCFQLFFSDGTLIAIIYSAGLPDWAMCVKYVLALYPPFNFAIMLNNIAEKAEDHYDSHKQM